MTRIAVIVGSTRPGPRRTEVAAAWVKSVADRHPAAVAGEAVFELVDVADFGLPVLDEPLPAFFGEYSHAHTQRWSQAIASFDGFLFVTPEYNHSIPGSLKNAIDFLFGEWNNKAAGYVSHGVHGGTRAVEHLRQVLCELKVVSTRGQVALSAFTDFELNSPTDAGFVTPGEHQEPTLHEVIDELLVLARALRGVREAEVPAV